MTYEDTMTQIARTTKELRIVDGTYQEYAKQVQVALLLLDTSANRKLVRRLSNTTVTKRNIVELFLEHLPLSDENSGALESLGVSIMHMQGLQSDRDTLMYRKKHAIKQLQVTADSGVEIRTLSAGRNSIMVSAKTAGMKHPVTRHLRKQGSVWTGKPLVDIGEDVFIQYHVTNNYVSEAAMQVAGYLDAEPIPTRLAA